MQTETGLHAPWTDNFGLMSPIFLLMGVGNASPFRQYPINFSHSPLQGAGVIGWTAAVTPYGPFLFATLIGVAITTFVSPISFFLGIGTYYIFSTVINCCYYTRKGCEKSS